MTPAALLAWRKRHRLTQAEAARLIGISVRQLARYEAAHAAIPCVLALACGWVECAGPNAVYRGETFEELRLHGPDRLC